MYSTPSHWMVVDAYRYVDKQLEGRFLNTDNDGTVAWRVFSTHAFDSYFVPNLGLTPRNMDARVQPTADVDGDGVLDFDEDERFESSKNDSDTDDDQVSDKEEIRNYTFHGTYHPTHGLGPSALADIDADGSRAENDCDSDNDGDFDGGEDIDGDGHNPEAGETCMFDEDAWKLVVNVDRDIYYIGDAVFVVDIQDLRETRTFHANSTYHYEIGEGCPDKTDGSALRHDGTFSTDENGRANMTMVQICPEPDGGLYYLTVDVLGDELYSEPDNTDPQTCWICCPWMLRCPEDSLFDQPAQGGASPYWHVGASDEYLSLVWYDDFSDVHGDVCDIHFWGVMQDYVTGAGCLEDPTTFECKFFQSDAVTQIGSSYTISISPVDTGQVYDPDPFTPGDEVTLWEFSADLDPCVPLFSGETPTTEGWVSIRAMGTDSCVFSWAAHDVCGPEAFSIVWDSETEAFYYDFIDWSLCLTGEQGYPVLGACCYEPTGDCVTNEITSCVGEGYRFEAYVSCEDLYPPCGIIEGACCDPLTGFCSYATEGECATAEGTFIAHGTCYPNTCPQPDPCQGPTLIYEQAHYDVNPDARPLSYRNYSGSAVIATADVLLEGDTEISDFHWWATEEDCFQWSGLADVLVFEDVAGEPGTVDILNPGPYPEDNPYYDIPSYKASYNGETIWGGLYEVVIYTIILGEYEHETEEFPPITLPAGTYWIGMRPVGMLYDSSALMVTLDAIGEPYRQKWDDEATWEPAGAGDPDIAFCLTSTGSSCPAEVTIVANPPSGAIDARKPHPIGTTTTCYGFGMPDDPATALKDESTYYPIVIDLGVTSAGDLSCWSYCETPDMSASACGSNSIASVTDNGDGTYTIILHHGIQGGTVATIQYNGGSYVEYFHHPANADGSSSANANDIVTVVDCLNTPGLCADYESDIDVSGAQAPNDIIEVIDLLNGAGAYDPWFNTTLPVNDGSCP